MQIIEFLKDSDSFPKARVDFLKGFQDSNTREYRGLFKARPSAMGTYPHILGYGYVLCSTFSARMLLDTSTNNEKAHNLSISASPLSKKL